MENKWFMYGFFFRLKKKWLRDKDSLNILSDVVHHLTHSKNTALSISLSSSRNESVSEGFVFISLYVCVCMSLFDIQWSENRIGIWSNCAFLYLEYNCVWRDLCLYVKLYTRTREWNSKYLFEIVAFLVSSQKMVFLESIQNKSTIGGGFCAAWWQIGISCMEFRETPY